MSQKFIVPADLFARTQVISGLRQLADFLEAHPSVPVATYGYTLHQFTDRHREDARLAQVNAIADLLGVPVTDETDRGGHLYASRTFGRITYEVCHVPQRNREDFRARSSYENNIILDTNTGTEAA